MAKLIRYVFMTVEFTNQTYTVEKTLLMCFRAQAARCHEYVIFINRMMIKYPDMDSLSNIASNNGQLPFVTTHNWKSLDNQLKNIEGFSEADTLKFVQKYSRMVESKLLFQRLNGDYENYR